jgi:hypothetical protein
VRRDDPLTLAAVGVAAAVVAQLAHETLGHGGTCLAVGGRVTLLTAVWFRCLGGGPLTDLMGPAGNLIAGVLVFALAGARRLGPATRLFVILLGGLNLFWFAGQSIFSGLFDTEDVAYAARALGWPAALWRSLSVLAGLAVYGVALRVLAARLRSVMAPDEPPAALRVRVAVPFAAAVISGIAAGLLWPRNPLGSALNEAGQFGLSSLVGWLSVRRAIRLGPSSEGALVTRSWLWLAGAALLFAAFAIVQGRGLGPLA